MAVTITNNKENNQYEARDGNQFKGLAAYKVDGDTIDFYHTKVSKEYEGQGIAAKIVTQALNESRAAGLTVKPSCPYVAHFIDKHPEYQDLI